MWAKRSRQVERARVISSTFTYVGTEYQCAQWTQALVPFLVQCFWGQFLVPKTWMAHEPVCPCFCSCPISWCAKSAMAVGFCWGKALAVSNYNGCDLGKDELNIQHDSTSIHDFISLHGHDMDIITVGLLAFFGFLARNNIIDVLLN